MVALMLCAATHLFSRCSTDLVGRHRSCLASISKAEAAGEAKTEWGLVSYGTMHRDRSRARCDGETSTSNGLGRSHLCVHVSECRIGLVSN